MMFPSAITSPRPGPAYGAPAQMPGARPLLLDEAKPGKVLEKPDDTLAQAPAEQLETLAAQVKAWRDARTQRRSETEVPEKEILAMPGPLDLFRNPPAPPAPQQRQEPSQAARDAWSVQVQAVMPQAGMAQAGMPQGDVSQAGLPQAAPPSSIPLQVGQPQLSQPHAGPAQGYLPQVAQPQPGPAQVGLPRIGPQDDLLSSAALPVDQTSRGTSQASLPGMGLPQAVLPDPTLPQAVMPQAALPGSSLPEVAPVEAGTKEMVKPWEMSPSGPLIGTPAQAAAPTRDTPDAAQARDALVHAGATPTDKPHHDTQAENLAKPFDLFHPLPMSRLAETVEPVAMPLTLDQSLVQMATRLLVSDGSDGRRQVQIEIAQEKLPGVVVDVFEADGRIVSRFTCSDAASHERLCSGATWLADSLMQRLQRDSRVEVQTDDPADPRLLQIDANA